MLDKIFGKNNGYTDSPALVDSFNIERYIVGLANFIENCNTPMTVAIQGDWGTGKTSIMSMIKNRIELGKKKDSGLVWFNTWQFSQFNMSDQLPVLMMSKLVRAIGGNDNTEGLTKMLGGLAVGMTSLGVKAGVNFLTGGAINANDFNIPLNHTDVISEIENFKNEFQKLINKKAGTDGRVVIFVDDLDRLQPAKAVELLEVLKIFLDCEKCVFVLAIDYGVVSRGVKDKYGDDFAEEKGRSFFDKIIQVPFKMPVADYDIANYVKAGFKNIGLELKDENRLEVYVSLINTSIGNNPRSMKRLFNAYLLLNYISSGQLLQDFHNREILFALLCMQSRFEKVYNYIIANKDKADANFIKNLSNPTNELFVELNLSEEDKDAFKLFAECFFEVIDADNSYVIDENELKVFKEVLSFSAITAANSSSEEEKIGDYRQNHKEICREMIPKLNEVFKMKNIQFKEFYRRTQEKSSWWIYVRQEDSSANKLRFGFEIKLSPSIVGNIMKSSMDICVYKLDKKQSVQDLVNRFGNDPLGEVLKVKPLVGENGIYYNNVIIFDSGDQSMDAKLFEIVKNSFEIVEKEF